MQLRGRAVSLTNAVFAAALVVVLASVALVVRPPAPPGIAEFAPRATKPISKAPPGQGTRLAAAPDGACTPTPCGATPSRSSSPTGQLVKPKPTGVPSALQCYEWSDGKVTQTFDPQSPPCIASWSDAGRGNGGSTSQGVSGTEIRIGVPMNPKAPPSGVAGLSLKPLETFFNQHYQFYGRRLRLVDFNWQGNAETAQELRADVVTASRLHVFASLDHTRDRAREPEVSSYLDGLAQHRIIGVTFGGALTSDEHMAEHAPFQWSYRAPMTTLQRAMGEVACRELKGVPVSHSDAYRGRSRSYAIVAVVDDREGKAIDTSRLKDGLAACGITAPLHVIDPTSPTNETQVWAGLQGERRTTVFLFGGPSARADSPMQLVKDAFQAGYAPEWVIPGGASQDDESTWQGNPGAGNVIGIGAWNRTLRASETPSERAVADVGAPPLDDGGVNYPELALLAAGIQLAGPQLTPTAFGRGLQQAAFPNPGAAAWPYHQATVGFGGAHTMMRDFALIWWNPLATSRQPYTDRQKGAFCYVLRAKRWRLGSFPGVDHFQDSRTSLC